MDESKDKYPTISYDMKEINGKIVRTNFRWQDEDGNVICQMDDTEAEILSQMLEHLHTQKKEQKLDGV